MVRACRPVSPVTGVVTAVQHFCLHDGPGIRSIVFLKGCPLRCQWCQNPETWKRRRELAFKAHLCVGCGLCVESCRQNARPAPGEYDAALCTGCFECAQACPAAALVVLGDVYTAAELFEEQLRPELPLYASSGGGVTLSGGEPMASAPFAADLATLLDDAGVHVTVETCGAFDADTEETERLLAAADLVLFDIKLRDGAAHREHCGGAHEKIVANLTRLGRRVGSPGSGPRLWPRLPLVPGVTTTRDNLVGWARLLLELGFTALTLVPYHRMGESKRSWLGLEAAPDFGSLDAAALDEARETLSGEGLTCFAPGEEEWGPA